MTLCALFGLLATSSLMSMHPTKDSNFSIMSLPKDVITYVTQLQGFEDQLSFTSTCKQFSKLPVHAHHLQPSFYPKYSRFLSVYTHPLATGILATHILMYYCDKCCSILKIDKTIPLCTLYTLSICRTLYLMFNYDGIEELHISKMERIQKDISHLTTVYQNIAQRMHSKKITTDALHIDYCASLQARPLLKAAHKLGILTVTIDIQEFYNPKPLNLYKLIAKNTHLKKVKISNISNKSHLLSNKLLCTNSFCKSLVRNTHLKTLKLSGLQLSTKLLVHLTSQENITKLSLSYCYSENHPHTYSMLAQNTTLEHLAIRNTDLSDSAVPNILAFMQHNKKLQSLIITQTHLSNASIHQLTTSPYKPAHFNVTNE